LIYTGGINACPKHDPYVRSSPLGECGTYAGDPPQRGEERHQKSESQGQDRHQAGRGHEH
jgi:hypothetical protein